MKRLILIIVWIACGTLYAATNDTGFVEQIGRLAGTALASLNPVTLKGTDRISTAASFAPPVEIDITAKTDSTNLRIAYAADQVIFNWDKDSAQLRIDGGPADGHHKQGAGQIPKNKFVTIKWIVLPDKQQIFVDGDLRFEHVGDYASIDRPVSVFCNNSRVTVTSIKVKQLGKGADAAVAK